MTPETWQQLKTIFHAALDLEPEDRGEFLTRACDGDDRLRGQVEKLFLSNDEVGDFLAAPALVDAGLMDARDETQTHQPATRVGQRIGQYEIIREIGRGGMGTVFLAVRADDQYRKQVAIKVVNRGMDTDSILRRFVMERQILANLEHPNIAGLLDGGTTADDLPYFVMEFVEGQPIDEYCEAQALGTAPRLELFREVCGALHYAHQNLVIHRDVKPSNILITSDGVPKLLDFGIAKLLSPDWDSLTGEVTASMVQLMTPAYASPEQLRGLSITTASDVYSLGVVFYELLTGQLPYRSTSRNPGEMAQVILREEPARPSTVGSWQNSGGRNDGAEGNEQRKTDGGPLTSRTKSEIRNPKFLRGDLDNIALKALRREPERRYASVQEFAEDIRRHLEGLPVVASPDTLSYRTRKFIQRNRAAAVAAAVVLIILLGATGVTAWQARVARRERDKAERRFKEVRKLANAVLFKYHDGIEKLPGSTPVREMLVQDALGYLDTLAKEAGDDPSLQRELAAAYKKVGDVQGAANIGNTGDTNGMLDSYRKALAIREAIAAENPTNRDDRSALAGTYIDVGNALDRSGDPSGKMDMSRKALTIYLELSAIDKTSSGLKSDLARAYWHVANASTTLGDFQSGIENYRSAGKIYEELSATEPSNQLHRRNVALTDKYLATALELNGDAIHAQELFRKAVARDEARVASDANNVGSRLDLAFSYRELGTNLSKLGDPTGANGNLQKSLALTLAVVEADPKNAFARRALAAVYSKIGEALSQQGDLTGALENQQKAAATYGALAAADPNNAEARSYEARSYSALGRTYTTLAADEKSPERKQLEDLRFALLWLQRSSGIWAGLRKQGPLISAFANEPEKVESEIAEAEVSVARLTNGRSKIK